MSAECRICHTASRVAPLSTQPLVLIKSSWPPADGGRSGVSGLLGGWWWWKEQLQHKFLLASNAVDSIQGCGQKLSEQLSAAGTRALHISEDLNWQFPGYEVKWVEINNMQVYVCRDLNKASCCFESECKSLQSQTSGNVRAFFWSSLLSQVSNHELFLSHSVVYVAESDLW